MGRATAGARAASVRERSAGSTEPNGRTPSACGSVLVAGCLVLLWSMQTGDSFATSLEPEAYGIRAGPSPGPVQEFQPIRSLPPVPFALPFDWGMDPYDDRTWRFRLHTLRTMVDKALVAGDFGYAREVFLDWQRWHENCWWSSPLCFERASDQSWDDMATGIRASRLAYLLRSTGWRDKELLDLAERHAEKLQEPGFLNTGHNHAIFQLHGLAALCRDAQLRACRGVADFISRELGALLRSQFTESGMHRENSPGYHFFAADNLARMAPLIQAFAPELDAVLARAGDAKKWLVHPDLTLVQLGDTDPVLPPRWRDGIAMPDGDPDCRGVRSYAASADCYLTKHFEDTGYVIVRSDWAIPAQDASMLFIQGGFFNPTHRDADDLSFEWFEHGRKILSDSGKYLVTDNEWRSYFDSTRAHNTVEVDGADYPHNRGPDAVLYGSAVEHIERSGDGIRIILEVEHESLKVGHRREISYRPGQQLVVEDTMRSDAKRRYVQWHHLAREFELSGDAGHFQARDDEGAVDIGVASSCGERTTYEMVKGQTEPRIQGWASVAVRERHPRWALGVVCEAATARFTARFTLAEAGHARAGQAALAAQR